MKVIESIIGLEIHVQLATKSKMFCGCSNKGEDLPPNTTVCEVCTGQPGVLPVPNSEALEMAVKIALALNCKVNSKVKFDRKHYFYPDLPKGYQISQFDLPIGEHGQIEVKSQKSKVKSQGSSSTSSETNIVPEQSEAASKDNITIGITRVHLEEDAAKLVHNTHGSLVDYNRGGTPLVEIVTEPDFRSPAEAKAFMQELRTIVRYLGVSEGDMEKGHLRCDANISLRKITEITTSQNHKITGLKPKVEIKNINSFRNVERALEFEINRLAELLEQGKYPESQETRGWNDARQVTEEQRGKEEAEDYRYMPEPDIPMLILYQDQQNQKSKISASAKHQASVDPPKFLFPNKNGGGKNQNEGRGLFKLDRIKAELPELPGQKYVRFKKEYGFSDSELRMIVEDQKLADYIEQTYSELVEWLDQSPEVEGTAEEILVKFKPKITKIVSGWILNKLFEVLSERGESFADLKITPENFAEFLALIYTNKISSTIGQELLRRLAETGGDPSQLLEDMGGGQVSHEDSLSEVCDKILSSNQENVASYKKGKTNLIQFFIGQAMKETKGRANPEVLRKMFEEKLK